jgi:hypothetical protein
MLLRGHYDEIFHIVDCAARCHCLFMMQFKLNPTAYLVSGKGEGRPALPQLFKIGYIELTALFKLLENFHFGGFL